MSILSLILYGSCARGDNNPSSDVDIFALTTEGDYRMTVSSKVNVALYPKSLAESMCENGDLFMLHIVQEGKVIFDSQGSHARLVNAFKYRPSYEDDIVKASDLGWALHDLARGSRNFTMINRRIAWCVRTILIARSAQERRPVFSARLLEEYSNDASAAALISNKDADLHSPGAIPHLASFLRRWGRPRPVEEVEDYLAHFSRTGNVVGTKTLRFLSSESISFGY